MSWCEIKLFEEVILEDEHDVERNIGGASLGQQEESEERLNSRDQI